jgi:signal transduction histidine kinase
LRAALSAARASGTVNRAGQRFAEVALPARGGAILLLSAPLHDSLGNVDLVRRRLLAAGALALLMALVIGYGGAWAFARRLRRLEHAAERIATGRFDQPVIDTGADEVGQLARAFERMRQRLAQLDHARKAFIANASHELRTPLFSLGGFLELLTDEELDEGTRREFLETMREQVGRLTKLATELLDLSRLDAGQLAVEREPVSLAETARTVAAEFQAVARTADHLLAVDAGEDPVAIGDEQRVLQIARMLVENAVVHTPQGTTVRLRTESMNGVARLAVEDDGPGISSEHAPHVFDRFYRVDGTQASGSGLGLSIARELAELMGGSLELQAVPGRTVFVLQLPGHRKTRENDLPDAG